MTLDWAFQHTKFHKTWAFWSLFSFHLDHLAQPCPKTNRLNHFEVFSTQHVIREGLQLYIQFIRASPSLESIFYITCVWNLALSYVKEKNITHSWLHWCLKKDIGVCIQRHPNYALDIKVLNRLKTCTWGLN